MGPYNKELYELTAFTQNPSLLQQLCGVLDHKLRQIITSGKSPTRSPTVVLTARNHPGSPPAHSVRRSLSLPSRHRVEVVVLKCLTVILYLLQYGSGGFILWIRNNYTTLVTPLCRLAWSPQHSAAIYYKADVVIEYCKNDAGLLASRNSLDGIRAGLRPGYPRPLSPGSAENVVST